MDKQNNKLKILYLKMIIVHSVLYSKNSFTPYIYTNIDFQMVIALVKRKSIVHAVSALTFLKLLITNNK
jgi:hypothetical protein